MISTQPKTVETAVVPLPFFATYIATKQFGNDVPLAASNSESEMVGTPKTCVGFQCLGGTGSS